MGTAQRLAMLADILRDLSAQGLMFSETVYQREHFGRVQDVAMELLAIATGEPLENLRPLAAPLFARPTPFSVGDAAIFDQNGRLLLIQRADNGHWALPGGALGVGESPAEGVAREALEETGIRCEPYLLGGVYDSRMRGTPSRHHLYQLLFICRALDTEPLSPPSHAHETLAIGWFLEEELPAPLDPGHTRPIHDAFAVWRGDASPFFDRVPL